MPSIRRAGVAAALAALPVAAAYRFAVVYRARAGIPRRRSLLATPADLGLPFEDVAIQTPEASLAAWFVPASGEPPAPAEPPAPLGGVSPAVLLVHGWESARDRTLPMARFLHAAGFHVMTIDVRGHGANPPESLPVSGAEFGADAAAGIETLLARPDVGAVGIVGHSIGAIGALLAAADDRRVGAVVAVSAPVDPVRLTRRTFQLARLPLPDPVAYPLAWVTSHLYVRPRRHRLARVSASRAVARYRGPLLLVHGDADGVVPLSHHARLATRAERARRSDPEVPPVETLVVRDGAHSWLYEDPAFRSTVAGFLARALGGPLAPEEAARRAAAVDAHRLDEPEVPFSGAEPGTTGLRIVAELLGAPVRRPVSAADQADTGR